MLVKTRQLSLIYNNQIGETNKTSWQLSGCPFSSLFAQSPAINRSLATYSEGFQMNWCCCCCCWCWCCWWWCCSCFIVTTIEQLNQLNMFPQPLIALVMLRQLEKEDKENPSILSPRLMIFWERWNLLLIDKANAENNYCICKSGITRVV